VREQNRQAAAAPGDSFKKGQPFVPPGCLDRLFRARGERSDIRRAELKVQAVFLCEPLDKTRITFSRPPPQTVFKMADDQLAITLAEQPVQQRDRVASA
jgi:hypothetical protein